jgi:AcrR family transcriptional regulator
MKNNDDLPVQKMGLREKNKLGKLERIKVAAAELFTEKGFEKATTRDIAARAEVGLGTLFLYAQDKRDLVFLIFNEELDRFTHDAFARVNPKAPLEIQFFEAFSLFYEEFYKNITLSRILLKELVFFSEGMQAEPFYEGRERSVNAIADLIERKIGSEEIAPSIDRQLASQYIFFIFAGAVRWWIAEETPDLARGLQKLKSLFELAVNGFAGQGGGGAIAKRKN